MEPFESIPLANVIHSYMMFHDSADGVYFCKRAQEVADTMAEFYSPKLVIVPDDDARTSLLLMLPKTASLRIVSMSSLNDAARQMKSALVMSLTRTSPGMMLQVGRCFSCLVGFPCFSECSHQANINMP